MIIEKYRNFYRYYLYRFRIFASVLFFNPLIAELNPTCHFLVLLGAHPILHISRIRVNHLFPIIFSDSNTLIRNSQVKATSILSVRYIISRPKMQENVLANQYGKSSIKAAR